MTAVPDSLVELHLHLEGCLSPRRARALWEHGRGFPDPPAGAIQGERWKFEDLGGFLQLFGWAARLLDGPRGYLELLDDAVEFLEAQGVIYAELQVAIGVMHFFEIDPRAVLPALAERAREHEQRGGVQLQFIADGVRQFGVEKARRVLADALDLREHRIVGFGLGGDERARPASAFAELYELARSEGLGTCLHAGEGTSAEAVSDALSLGVDRIGHGIAAVYDEELVARLVEAGTVLEVCPSSNLRSGAWRNEDGPHPIHRLSDCGVRVVLGSDDPAFFECSLRGEFERCAAEGISAERLARFNATAVEASFLSPERKQTLRRRVC